MDIAIDFGGSIVDILVKEKNKERFETFQNIGEDYNGIINKLFRKYIPKKIIVTGGKSKYYNFNHKNIVVVDELQSIVEGVKHISKINKGVIANLGTGVPILQYDKDKFSHIGGTGMGGGTLLALAKLIFGIDILELDKLAVNGDIKNVDISVADIVGGNIGNLNGEYTASNLGKVIKNKYNDSDLAIGIINMITQVIARYIDSLCKDKKENVIISGRLSTLSTVQSLMEKNLRLFGYEKIYLPEKREVATVIGASIFLT